VVCLFMLYLFPFTGRFAMVRLPGWS
jgi:hypothetical protein